MPSAHFHLAHLVHLAPGSGRAPRLAAWLTLFFALRLTLVTPARAEEKAKVVFVAPPGDALEASLRDALTAQLAGGAAEVVFEHFATTSQSLRSQVSEARSLASVHDAIGVFWLDAQAGNDWLVYLSEPSGDRVLVRRVTVDAGGDSAASEAVAVITRQSAEALAAGQSIGMQPVEVPAEPPPQPHPAAGAPVLPPMPRPDATRPHGIGARVAYAGDSPASHTDWQNGLRLELTYRARQGAFVGAGFTFFQELVVTTPSLVFRVTRYPLDFDVGMALGHGRLVPALELRGIVDVMRRHTVSVASASASTATSSLLATPSSTRALFLLGPRVSLGYALSPRLELYVAAGADFALNGFSFTSEQPVAGGAGTVEQHNLLELRDIRPAVEFGGAFWQ